MKSELNWGSAPIAWGQRSSWFDPVTDWLSAETNSDEIRSLRRQGGLELCWGELEWRDVYENVCDVEFETSAQELAQALCDTSLRVFHGCRVEDASVFLEQGIRLNDPSELEARARRLACLAPHQESLLQNLEQFVKEEDSFNRDIGALHLALDARELIGDCSHYALYGSEWILSALGWSAHSLLRSFGIPTIIEVEIPIRDVSPAMRKALSDQILQEWVHFSINQPDWVPVVDFGICLRKPIPPSQITGHYHPKSLVDVFHEKVVRTTAKSACPSCA